MRANLEVWPKTSRFGLTERNLSLRLKDLGFTKLCETSRFGFSKETLKVHSFDLRKLGFTDLSETSRFVKKPRGFVFQRKLSFTPSF